MFGLGVVRRAGVRCVAPAMMTTGEILMVDSSIRIGPAMVSGTPSPESAARAIWGGSKPFPKGDQRMDSKMSGGVAGGLFIGLLVFAGWLQHLYTCFTHEKLGFLIAGAIFAPVGVIHGWGIWLGIW
jgi:hypothetical protein